MSKSSENVSPGGGKYQKAATSSGSAHGVEALQEVDPALLHSAVCAVLQAGDAVLLGTTRDGGAVAMQLYSGDSLDKLYCATLEELQDALRGVLSVAEQ